MTEKTSKWLKIAGVAILIAATGFVREFVFVNINEHLSHLWYGTEQSNMSHMLALLKKLDYWQLYYLKWALTLIFTGIYLVEAIWMLRSVTDRWQWKPVVFVYASLVCSSLFVFAFYALLGRTETGYTLTRFIMGIAQSPLPLMLLIPAVLLRTKRKD